MGDFLRFLAEQNSNGLDFELETARSVGKWLKANGMDGYRASRYRPAEGERSEDFPDVCVETPDGRFFIECKLRGRANVVNANFKITGGCRAEAKDEMYAGLAELVNGSDGFRRFRKFMTSGQDALGGLAPIDVYLGEKKFDPRKLVPRYNKLVRGGLTEADCKEFDAGVVRESTAGALACGLAWRLSNGKTWDICRVETDLAPYLIGKYSGAGAKYLQLGKDLFVVDPDDNPLGIDAPAFPEKAEGVFSLRFAPRFGVGGMYIAPRSELKRGLSSTRDFNDRDRWPERKAGSK